MRYLVAIALAASSAPAAAEVVSASDTGFEVRHTLNLVVKPEVAFRSFANLPGWWNPAHTYSGSSDNLRLELTPGGCFCERFPKSGGGIEHLRVAYLEPGKRIILTGSLGPLLYEATSGVLDAQFKSTAAGAQVTFSYRAAGFYKGGAGELAPVVDKVLTEQFKRYRAFATARPRT